MPVSFDNISADWKLPLYWVEVDPSKAGFPTIKQPALLVGQKLSTGSAPADVPVIVATKDQGESLFGVGSMLSQMVNRFLDGNRSNQLYCLPVVEPSGGTAATGTITVSAAPTGAGILSLYIAGQRIQVSIGASDTTSQVATAIAAAITAETSLPVTAAAVAAVVTLTSKWKGLTSNDITVMVNYGGTFAGEVMPTSLALTLSVAKLAGGLGSPVFTAGISALGDEPYEYIAMPFTDSTSLLAWETEFGFSDSGRWGWMRQEYGHIFSAYRDTYSNLITWGASRNSGLTSVMAIEVTMPTPVWEVAASYASRAARALINDPARPLQTLRLFGCLPAPKHQRFVLSELNSMAVSGLATQNTGADGVPAILRETTTYQKNLYGFGDDAYTDVTTLATLARLFRNQRHAITSKFPRHKLADDGTRFGPGQAIVTPKVIKGELVSQYRQDEFEGLVENAKAFKDNLIVERDSGNPNRVNVLYPPDLVNQLRIFAVLAQFRLQYDRGVDLAIA